MNDIIEKFTRCPYCRSFSIHKLAPENKHRLLLKTHYCENCSHKFTLKVDNVEQETTAEEHLVTRKNHRTILLAVTAFAVLTVLVFTLPVFLEDKPFSGISAELNKKPAPVEEKIAKVETKKIKEKTDKPVADSRIGEKSKEPVPTAGMPENEVGKNKKNIEKKVPVVTVDKIEKVAKKNKGLLGLCEKVFEQCYVKVRSSHPDETDDSFRWCFKRKTISLERGEGQRVLIASDPAGEKKWLVDDALIINGRRVSGLNGDLSNIGVIPDENKREPLDITHLVPAGKQVTLKMMLADYGVFWGNTSIYVVVK